jgi:hypothetical protein
MKEKRIEMFGSEEDKELEMIKRNLEKEKEFRPVKPYVPAKES